jgi:hypothetical protein
MNLADLVIPVHLPQPDDRSYGEKLLLCATLYDALVILSHPHCKSIENKERLVETRQWLASNSEEPFSFLWVCAHLNIVPQKIRHEVMFGDFTKKTRRRRLGKNIKKTAEIAIAA